MYLGKGVKKWGMLCYEYMFTQDEMMKLMRKKGKGEKCKHDQCLTFLVAILLILKQFLEKKSFWYYKLLFVVDHLEETW